MVTESNKQVATLEFVSVETIVNETARLNKKYTGNISDTVAELLVGDTKGIQTKLKNYLALKKKNLVKTELKRIEQLTLIHLLVI